MAGETQAIQKSLLFHPEQCQSLGDSWYSAEMMQPVNVSQLCFPTNHTPH